MNPSEAAKVLAVAVTFDARLTPPSREDSIARAQAWSLALEPEMSEQEAIRLVVDHYRSSTDSVLPASLNRAYRRERESRSERAITSEALEDHRRAMEVAVPMPPEIKQEIHKLIHRQAM